MVSEDLNAAVWNHVGRMPCKPGGDPKASSLPPEDLVGRRVRVWWKDDRAWYMGTITNYDAKQGKHTVTYDDGDLEKLDLSSEIWRFLSDKSTEKAQASVSKVSVDVKVGTKRKSGAVSRVQPSSSKRVSSDNGTPPAGSKPEPESPAKPAARKGGRTGKAGRKRGSSGDGSRPEQENSGVKDLETLNTKEQEKSVLKDQENADAKEQETSCTKDLKTSGKKQRDGICSNKQTSSPRDAAGNKHLDDASLIKKSVAAKDKTELPAEVKGPEKQMSSQLSDSDREEKTGDKGVDELAEGTKEEVDPKREFVMQGSGFQVHRTQQPPAYEVFCQLPSGDLASTRVQQGDNCIIVFYLSKEVPDEREGGGSEPVLRHCKLVVNIPEPVGDVQQCVLTPDGRLYIQIDWKQAAQAHKTSGAMQ